MGNIIGSRSQRENTIRKQEEVVRNTTNRADKKGEQALLDNYKAEHQEWLEMGR